MSFRKIVVAVDMDQNCLDALTQIKTMSIPETTEIHLVHVFEYVPNFVDLNFVLAPSDKDMTEIQMALTEKLTGVRKILGLEHRKNVEQKCLVSVNAKQEFLQYVDKAGPDLVVAASEEKTGFIGLFEGSFTAFLTKYCRANLLILRPIPRYNVG